MEFQSVASAYGRMPGIRGPYNSRKKVGITRPASGDLFISEWRMALGWTIKQLSEASGVAQSTISEAEDPEEGSNPRPATLDKIAKALGCTPGQLRQHPTVENRLLPAWQKLHPEDQDEVLRQIEFLARRRAR